jgi:hypothetical protein
VLLPEYFLVLLIKELFNAETERKNRVYRKRSVEILFSVSINLFRTALLVNGLRKNITVTKWEELKCGNKDNMDIILYRL